MCSLESGKWLSENLEGDNAGPQKGQIRTLNWVMKRAMGSPRGSFKIILGFHTDHKSHRDMTGSQNILKPIANSEPAQGSG